MGLVPVTGEDPQVRSGYQKTWHKPDPLPFLAIQTHLHHNQALNHNHNNNKRLT